MAAKQKSTEIKTEIVKSMTKHSEAAQKRAEVQNSKRVPYVIGWRWTDGYDQNSRVYGDTVQALSVENALAVFKRSMAEETNSMRDIEILSVNRV